MLFLVQIPQKPNQLLQNNSNYVIYYNKYKQQKGEQKILTSNTPNMGVNLQILQ